MKKWWKESVVYQIYPRSFCDSDGDGVGDIPGIISKLDYLKSLGVDVIWLSPVYPSPNDDNGYDISDYKDIHPDFGTLADFDRMVAECRARDIKIIMDLVINHTSDEHKWFKLAKQNDPIYRDYYIWKKGKLKGKKELPPNNWTSFFGGDAWKKEGEEYYLHLFSTKQPDLNWNNENVYREIKEVLAFWLDRGVAGFRCDVINIIFKTSLEDGKKHLALTGKEHYVSKEGAHEILRRLRKDILSKYDCFTVGETVLVNTQMARDLCSSERGELDMVFGFEHMESDQIGYKWFKRKFRLSRFKKVIDKWQRELEWNTNYLENHDQPRSISRFVPRDAPKIPAAKMLGLMVLSLRGTPFIYEGEEIGMTNGDFESLDEIMDVESHTIDKLAVKLHFPKSIRWKMIKYTSRDNARTPMQWNNSENAGFTSGTPWLKVNSNYKSINVENQSGDKNSVLSFYKQIINYRKNSPALLRGDYKMIKSSANTFFFSRDCGTEKLIIMLNFSDSRVKINMPPNEIQVSNFPLADKVFLQPYEGRIIKLAKQ